MEYPKEPITIDKQIETLHSRGLSIRDINKARGYLSAISYFRLSGYMKFYQKPGDTKHVFIEETDFEDIINLYEFDRELRLLVFDAIERIEVAVRMQIMHVMSLKYGKNWYENADLFDDARDHAEFITELSDICMKSKEMFIRHYLNTYDVPKLPPSWMVIEILSLGQISSLFANLNAPDQRREICKYFNTHDNIFESWLHSLSSVRNLCAHHSRLWNRTLTIRPIMPTKKSNKFLEKANELDTGKLYTLLCCIQYLLNAIYHDASFKYKLKNLLKKYSTVPTIPIGFTNEWDKEKLWTD